MSSLSLVYKNLVSVSGNVKDDVNTEVSDQIVIRLGGLTIDDSMMPGLLYVTSDSSDIKRGDKLILRGILSEGFGNFSGVMYRAVVDKNNPPKTG